ncbi:FxsA family protein [Salicola sp. Rm-C-2C1-2]|uniref:FxsA family protein n=1 Tax=Salicola sp. Rm-C-2C1-2 TaxID=3141321 RepID=UPI0032E491D8
MPVFLIAFIIIPVIEMVILIEVGGLIGALPTVGLVLLTAVIGAGMLRQQGAATLLRANQRMASGELPAQEMAEGLLLAVGGALLLTPGFVTDAVGFACLIPFTRRWLSGYVVNRMVFGGGASMGGHYQYHQSGQFHDRGPRRDAYGNIIIEGEFEQQEQPRDDHDPDRLDRQ